MKAKHILTAMAMPVLFAACTSDELVPANEGMQSQRPLLSKDFSITTGNATRYSVSNDGGELGFDWDNKDSFGALLVDQNNGNAMKDWDITPGTGGNTKFEYVAETNDWRSIAQIGVGHYLFVYPHEEEDNERRAAFYSLPTVQVLEKDGELNLEAEVERSNKSFAPKMLRKNDKTIKVDLMNLYSYPKFKIQFGDTEDIKTVEKVVLQYSQKFEVEGGLDHNAIWTLQDNPNTDWSKIQTAALLRSKDGYCTPVTSEFIIAELPENTPIVEGAGSTDNKYIEVRFMIPGMVDGSNTTDYYGENGKLNMYVYGTDSDGEEVVYKITNVHKNIKFKPTTSDAVIKSVFSRNASYNLTLKLGAVELDEKADFNFVTNQDDWDKLVRDYGDLKNVTKKITIMSSDFALDTDADMPEEATFKVMGDLKIGGNVALKNVTVDNGKKIIVNEGATLTPGEGVNSPIENYGTVELVDNYGSEIKNMGVVNVNTNENIVKAKIINGEYTDDDDYTVGTINVGKHLDLLTGSSNAQESIINVTGKMCALGTVTNKGTVNNGENALLHGYGNLTNYGLIKQNGKAMELINGVDGTMTGTVEIGEKATETNFKTQNGIVDITDNFNANITPSDAQKNLHYTLTGSETIKNLANKKGLAKLIIDGGTVEGSDKWTSGDEYVVVFANTVEVTGNGATLMGNAGQGNGFSQALTLHGDVTVQNFTFTGKVNIASGTTTVQQTVTAATIELGSEDEDDEDVAGTLLVSEGATLYVYDIVKNNNVTDASAIVENNGKIIVTDHENTTYDIVVTGQLTWKGNPSNGDTTGKPAATPTDKRATYMHDAVAEWANVWYEWMGGNGTVESMYYDGNPYQWSKFANVMTSGYTPWVNWKTKLEYKTEKEGGVTDANDGFVFAFGGDLFAKHPAGHANVGEYVGAPSGNYFEDAVDDVYEDDRDPSTLVTKTYADMAEEVLYNADNTYKFGSFGKDSKLYKNDEEAQSALLKRFVNMDQWPYWVGKKSNSTLNNEEKKLAAKLSAYVYYKENNADGVLTDVYTRYIAAQPYDIIVKGCDLDVLVDAINEVTIEGWNETFSTGWTVINSNIAEIVTFLKEAENCTTQSVNGDKARAIARQFSSKVVATWKYTPQQVAACGKLPGQ